VVYCICLKEVSMGNTKALEVVWLMKHYRRTFPNLHHHVRTGFGARRTFYRTGTLNSFLGGTRKATGA